ncbi:MAG: acyl-CoA thioester hydrolase [Lachnospiraceae bacterium]|nr:acyl-CoA thioester hydrolase [Lachnospiraceae bacterium]
MKGFMFEPEKGGFYGAYYPNKSESDHAFIVMLGDDVDGLLCRNAVKWLRGRGYNCLAMAPAKKDYGHHNYPLERFEKAIAYLKSRGNSKIGIIGGSTTGMLALIAASYFSDITMTLAFTPSDFVMEGFYQDGKDGMKERPGDGESTVSYHGKPLTYFPFAYRHPEYWQRIMEETKGTGNMLCSVEMFEESERRHPLQEDEKIKVENIHGHVLMVGAKDDTLWNAYKYVRRMDERLKSLPHECTYDALVYEYGTHFVFPESMIKMVLPFGSEFILGKLFKSAKEHPKECRETRIDIDRKVQRALKNW